MAPPTLLSDSALAASEIGPFSEIGAAMKTWAEPAWLAESRKAAIDRFEALGLPTTRLEAWRTTPFPEMGAGFAFANSTSPPDEARAVVTPFCEDGAVTLVFVDGFHSEALSTAETSWPRGVRIAPLSRVITTSSDEVRRSLEDLSPTGGALHELNTAAFRDGASIVVEDGVVVPVELRVVIVATAANPRVAQHLRNLVHVGRGARLRLLMAVVGSPSARGFVNNHTAIRMAERSRLDLVRVHESPIGVPHFDALSATLDAHSVLSETLLQTGPSWTRSEIDIALKGERASADLGGVFVARRKQISDIHTILSHEAPGVVSRQNYRGLAADEARGVFHGQIRVEAGARGADATQSNKNMLLSKRAQVHSTPALEILTDDVKCKHGSATGQIDQAQLFFLRSRGIDPQAATRMLTRAFASEILSRVNEAGTRALIEGQVQPSLDQLGVAA